MTSQNREHLRKLLCELHSDRAECFFNAGAPHFSTDEQDEWYDEGVRIEKEMMHVFDTLGDGIEPPPLTIGEDETKQYLYWFDGVTAKYTNDMEQPLELYTPLTATQRERRWRGRFR